MRFGIAVWNNRVASVGDVAPQIEIWEKDKGDFVLLEKKVFSRTDEEWERVKYLIEEDVDIFICGAISGRMEFLLLENGIEVEGWISGNTEELFLELKGTTINFDKFRLQCCRQERRKLRKRRRHRR
jgi:predicted Fe-Mo cluster-binding NifX family protein